MGQAKARGAFDQRKAEAVARNEASQRDREMAEHKARIEREARRAHAISKAIQDAYSKGSVLGRLQMQQALEQWMDELNRA